MQSSAPDSSDPTGNDSSRIPSDMDSDPRADEEVIDQRIDEQYPKPVKAPEIAPDNLADSIAYALDGSGPGPTNDTPNVSGHKVITEGTTGAGLDEEEDAT